MKYHWVVAGHSCGYDLHQNTLNCGKTCGEESQLNWAKGKEVKNQSHIVSGTLLCFPVLPIGVEGSHSLLETTMGEANCCGCLPFAMVVVYGLRRAWSVSTSILTTVEQLLSFAEELGGL